MTRNLQTLVHQRGVGKGTALMTESGECETFKDLDHRLNHLVHDKTINEMLQIMLSRGVKGLGGKAALAVASEWPTLADFIDFLAACSDSHDAEAKLQAFFSGPRRGPVSPVSPVGEAEHTEVVCEGLALREAGRAISSATFRALWQLYSGAVALLSFALQTDAFSPAALSSVQSGLRMCMEEETAETEMVNAAEQGSLAAVEKLLEIGTPVDGRDKNGNTALHAAASEGHDAGADPMALNTAGDTPMHYAAEVGPT
ncbi:hypothetical protein T484DRAFT_1841027 [Baffinella frigidus]|nr:hypothetical protein T484DRAFT_1841027 [Cryptophyta sp. CCMP2293]